MLNTELTVQCDTKESNFFKTDTGVPQGADFSAIDFTLCLLRELWSYVQGIHDHHFIQIPIHIKT